MASESVNWAQLSDTLEKLRQELNRLSERVDVLEANKKTNGREDTRPENRQSSVSVAVTAPEGPSEELVIVLGAAVAAFLGKRAPLRQIRLLGSAAWSQQGRVIIQASHTR
jgi:methylmalonyl-CoA carboxyltransferase large subunit